MNPMVLRTCIKACSQKGTNDTVKSLRIHCKLEANDNNTPMVNVPTTSGLKCHKTIVRKLQQDIAKLCKKISSQKKFEVSFPNSDSQRVPFTPTCKLKVQKSDATCRLPASCFVD